MIELLVALGILIIIMLAFSMIITQMQGTVSVGQKTIRTNAAAAAIIHTIRNDIRRITQQGLLCITQAPDGSPCLLFTTGGITPSRTSTIIGTGSLTVFGHCENLSPSAKINPCIFYSQDWVLSEDSSASDILGGYDLAYVQRLPRYSLYPPEDLPRDMNSLISFLFHQGWTPPQSLMIPPASASAVDIDPLWQVLAENCQAVSFMWSKNGLSWYGIDYTIDDKGTPNQYEDDTVKYILRPKPEPGEDSWRDRGPDDTDGTGAYYIQFNADELDHYDCYSGNFYRALWTHHNQNNWPRAIKIRFELVELVEPQERKTYEVICLVGG